MHTFDLSLDRVTKVEGGASLDVRVRDGKVKEANFKVVDHKRFYTTAMKGKNIMSLPQLLARICGTCSNAHLLCSIKSCEQVLGIVPSAQTVLLRILTMDGLMVRDHALHLYLFTMPDVFGKDAFLDFDEKDPQQHQMLHDGFEIKAAGNFLATLVAGRSVHALYPTIGGFLRFPEKEGIAEAIKKLEAARPAVLRLIEVFKNAPFHLERETNFVALVPERYGFLEGKIVMSDGGSVGEEGFREHLEHVVLPYSTASAYKYKGKPFLVGALARMNLAKEKLHAKTKETLGETLNLFPSKDVFRNNLAQAIEILHSLDDAVEILSQTEFKPEPVIKVPYREAVGTGVIEAPRGTLYHKVVLGADGNVKEGEIVVPTGQNQANIEEDVRQLVQSLLPNTPKEKISFEIEKLIRAYDPCMSCAAHFLKVNWNEE